MVDSIVVSKAIAFQLSFDLDTGRTEEFAQTVAAGEAAGLDGSALFNQDLFSPRPFGDATTVPDALDQAPPALPPYVATPTASSGGGRVPRWRPPGTPRSPTCRCSPAPPTPTTPSAPTSGWCPAT